VNRSTPTVQQCGYPLAQLFNPQYYDRLTHLRLTYDEIHF